MNEQKIKTLLERVNSLCKKYEKPVNIMEVCGTHTVSLMRSGVKSMLPDSIKLISGPGCPVCVTAQGYIDTACELSLRNDTIICTYGDMVRVPGGEGSLEDCSGKGADVKIVYSPRDAIKIAAQNPEKDIVFLAVGFETTTPPTALAVKEAHARGLDNFYVLTAHKLVIPAMMGLLNAGQVNIDGFMCPGHVSIIIGANAYTPIVKKFDKPCVVAGFEPAQMLMGIAEIIRQKTDNDIKVDNVYGVAVSDQGNTIAQKLLEEVFQVSDVTWRAMGVIPQSGLELKGEYKKYDAREKFGVQIGQDRHIPGCRCGEVIQGKLDPPTCELFAKKCTPYSPVGPCMVSSEGTCAAWYKYANV